MKKYVLATLAVLALASPAWADGKSRLEIAKDLADDCKADILYDLLPKGTRVEDCVASHLATLDSAIRRASGHGCYPNGLPKVLGEEGC